MLFYYDGHSNEPGIYKILNTHTGRIYIGQAKEFKERWTRGHASSLRNGKHQNSFIQNDFNKCFAELGNDSFLEFHVIEAMPNSIKPERKEREEHWIAKFYDEQKQCYNFKKTVSSNERTCFSLTPEQTIVKRATKLRGQKRSPEFCQAARERQQGTKHSPERIEINRLSHLGQIPWNTGMTNSPQSGSNHPMFGKHHSEESKQKNSESCKGRIPWNKGKRTANTSVL